MKLAQFSKIVLGSLSMLGASNYALYAKTITAYAPNEYPINTVWTVSAGAPVGTINTSSGGCTGITLTSLPATYGSQNNAATLYFNDASLYSSGFTGTETAFTYDVPSNLCHVFRALTIEVPDVVPVPVPTLTDSSKQTVYLDNNMGDTTVSIAADAAITNSYRCNDASTSYVNTKMVTTESGMAIKKNGLPTNFTLTYSDGSQASVSVPGTAVDLSLTFFPGAIRTCTDSSGQSHITYSYGAKVIKVNQ